MICLTQNIALSCGPWKTKWYLPFKDCPLLYREDGQTLSHDYAKGNSLAFIFSQESPPEWLKDYVSVEDYSISMFEEKRLRRSSANVTQSRPAHRMKTSKPWKVAIIERDGMKCVCCGSRRNLTVDHIHPKSKGGTDDPENLQSMCETCNGKKGDRIISLEELKTEIQCQ